MTDGDGIATLSSIEGETGELSVKHNNYTAYLQQDVMMPIGVPLVLRADLTKGGTVLVHALDAQGSPLLGASIESREVQVAQPPTFGGSTAIMSSSGAPNLGSETTESVTDSHGEVAFRHLTPGFHEFRIVQRQTGVGQISFAMAGMEKGGEPWYEVEVLEAGEHELELREIPRCSLSGRVTEAGENLAGAVVDLIASNPEGRGMIMGFPGMPSENSARTDGSGNFEITGVKPGRYDVKITHPNRVMPTSIPMELTAGKNGIDPDLPISMVEGTIRDLDGKPMPGIQVKAELASGDSQGDGIVFMLSLSSSDDGEGSAVQIQGGAEPGVTDAEGHYRLRGVTANTQLVISAKGDAAAPKRSEPFEVLPNETKLGVDLSLMPAGSLLVTLDGNKGFTLINASYRGEDKGIEDKRSFANDPTAMLTGLIPGPWEVSLQLLGPSNENGKPTPAPQEATIIAGEQSHLTFDL